MALLTPADELRAAAHLIRRHADGVTPGSWKSEASLRYGHRVGAANNSAWVARTGEHDEENSARDADWIALMQPSIGLSLADWLEAEATGPLADLHSDRCQERGCTVNAALAVARAINGTDR
jgi:hypothetical protein